MPALPATAHTDALALPSAMVPRLYELWQRLERRQAAGKACDRLHQQLQQLRNRGQQMLRQQEPVDWHLDYDQQLPVAAQREHILATLRSSPVMVLTGETGSGKTTQLPKMLIEVGAGWRGRMAITQPRRLAAVAVAQRLREECACDEEGIAHAVRFDDRSSEATRVVVQTDGLLLAELSRDPWLRRYDTIVIDEAHERSCTIDVLLALLLRLRRRRPDLRLVLTSATIDAERFAAYLGDQGEPVPLIAVAGRLYPVHCESRNPGDSDLGYLDAAVEEVTREHASAEAGDFLVFLPTERDILEARRRLQDLPGATVLPCYGRLNASEQQRIFSTIPGRKIVIATPIAETSLTIPGITLVIDSGLARCKRYHPQTRVERLPVEAISQANLRQRAGRAGRQRAGRCIQLFSAEDAAARPPFMEPEIRRSNLSVVLLQLLAAGHGDPEAMPWMDPPRSGGWQQAWRQLSELSAIDDQRRLTPLGRRLARLPVDPALARICLAGEAAGVRMDAVTVAAFLSIQDPRQRPPGEESQADQAHARFRVEGSDILTVCELWRGWDACRTGSERGRFARSSYVNWRRMREWADVRRQLLQLLREQRAPGVLVPADAHVHAQVLHQVVLAGMLGGLQRYDAERRCYRGIGGKDVVLHPSSVLQRRGRKKDASPPPWLVACELVETSRVFARLCAPVEVSWIMDIAGPLLRRHYGDAHWDDQRRRVVVHEQVTLYGLPLVDGRMVAAEGVIGREAAETVFVEQALAGSRLAEQIPVLRHNAECVEQARGVQHRLRDPSLHYDDTAVAAWYQQRLQAVDRGPDPRPLTSLAALRHFLRQHGENALRLSPSDCCPRWHEAQRAAPLQIHLGPQLSAAVSYRYSPGDPDDGASVEVSEDALQHVEPWRCSRCIPEYLREQVLAWLRRVPRVQRAQLGDTDMLSMELAQAILERSDAPPQACEDLLRQRLPADAVPSLSYEQVPVWTRPRWQIVDQRGRVVMESRDPGLFAGQGDADDPVTALRHRWRSPPSKEWPGDIPRQHREGSLTVYPVLLRSRDAQAEVAVQRDICASASAADIWHQDGVLAWCECHCAHELTKLVRSLQGEMAGYQHAAAVARAAILAAVSDALGQQDCRNQSQAQELGGLAQQQLTSLAPALHAWARSFAQARQGLARAQRQGGRGMAALSQMSTARASEEGLVGGLWWLRYPWWGLQALPDWLQGITAGLQRPAPSASVAGRMQRLRSDWQAVTSWIDLQVARACGHADDWRQGHAMVAECCYALSCGQRPRFGASELAVRSLADHLQRSVGARFQAWETAVRALREVTTQLTRHDGPVLQRLLEHAQALMHSGLDTGFAADVEQQPRDLEALRLRILRLL